MATDNVQIPKCSDNKGPEIASDLISGVQHQRVKVQYGADGTAVDVSSSNPLPVTGISGGGGSDPSTLGFSTTALLGDAETFDSGILDIREWTQVQTHILSVGASGTLLIGFYQDAAGSNLLRELTIPYADGDGYKLLSAPAFTPYVRYRFTTSGPGQTQFYYDTKFLSTSLSGQLLTLKDGIVSNMVAPLGRNVTVGLDDFNQYTNVGTTQEGSLKVTNPYSSSAFGDNISVSPKPQIELSFPYGKETANIIEFTAGSGSVISENSQLVLNTGTTTLSDAAFASQDFLVYEPGFGATLRFTFGCTTGASTVGTFQQVGIGTQEDGLFFSYEDDDMVILTRKGGLRDQHSFEITTAASSANNVSIELDGTTHSVSVTDASGSENQTADEIRDGINALSTGYIAHSQGNVVVFVSKRTGLKSGAFSFADPNATGTAATVSQEVVGVTENSTKILREDWNIDKADGTGILPLIDWSQGNVFQIRYQWLGYGAITFFLENPASGNLIPIHKIQYANSNTTPSVNNPSLQFLANAANALTTEDVSCFVGSVSGGIDGGKDGLYGNKHAETYSKSIANTGLNTIVNFRAPHNFRGFSNRSEVSILRLGFTASSAANIKLVKNPTLGGSANWTSLSSSVLLESDTSSTLVTNGTTVWAERAEKQDRFVVDPAQSIDQIVKLYPGDVLSICGTADSGTSNINVAVNWIEPV